MRRAALLLAALAVFGWHSLATQTHVHPAADRDAWLLETHHGDSSGEPAECPICREDAMSGLGIVPEAASFAAPALAAFWRAGTEALAAKPRQRSHIWQSRAPPRSFQG